MISAVKNWTWWLVLLISLCGLESAHAALSVPQDPVVLRDSGELYFLFDRSQRLTVEQVQRETQAWKLVTNTSRVSRDENGTMWLRLRLKGSDVDRQLILFLAVPHRVELQVYTSRVDAADRATIASAQPLLPLVSPRYLFPFQVRAGESIELYVRARGLVAEAINFLQLWPNEKMLAALPGMSALEWTNIGVMLLVTLASLILWLFTRQPLLWLLALFIGVQWILYVAARGYAQIWFWPNMPALTVLAGKIDMPLSLMINIGFTIVFLELQTRAPRLYRAALSVIALLFFMAAALIATSRNFEEFAILPVLMCELFLIGISYYVYRHSGYRHSNNRHGSYRGNAAVMFWCWTIWLMLTLALIVAVMLDPAQRLTKYGYDCSIQLRTVLFIICIGYHYQQTIRGEERARADARAKSEFLARMSHEIRTPMNGILGMSELLRDSGLSNTQRRYNDIVYSSATALLTVINDILDFSKIQAGRMSVEKIPFDLHRVAVDSLSLFRLKADEKNLELLCDIRPNAPAWVIGDPTRIRQILINFLSNAIKFTEAGEIRLQLGARGNLIRILVEDTGPGIAANVQPLLFESFMQGDVSIARQHGGTGLGLAITSQLAELMGGNVGVESRLGKGSTFWVDLPLPATAKQEAPSTGADLAGKSILVVDDNVHFCELVAENVRSWGMHWQIAHSGAEALACVRQLREKNAKFDLISIDLKMPGMNGLELAHLLKAECGAALPPMLLLTATTDIPQSATRRSAGIVLAQEKPLLAADLRAAFAQTLGLMPPVSSIEPKPAVTEMPQHALTVLVVEDNPTNQVVIQAMLRKLGHDCRLVSSGDEAIAMLEARRNDFDVVLMDCEMPGMSGYDATRCIRTFEREHQLTPKKIVALTAHTLEEHVGLCYEAGMDGHLAKPLGINQLRDFLARLNPSSVC